MSLIVPPLSLLYLDSWLLLLIWLVFIPFGFYAFVHALRQRSDAFTAVDKLTKPAWAGITGAGAFFLLVTGGPMGGFTGLFWLAALIAVLVYLVDVKPRVVEVQQGPRW